MHYQHHQLREPTSFGGPTVHVIELVLEYTIAYAPPLVALRLCRAARAAQLVPLPISMHLRPSPAKAISHARASHRHHLTNYLMPFHPVTHRVLGVFAFVFGAVFNHGGLTLDYNDHYAHHITWKGGRAKYCNYGMFFPFWDVLNGTRYDASSPPASAAKPKEALNVEMVDTVVPSFGREGLKAE